MMPHGKAGRALQIAGVAVVVSCGGGDRATPGGATAAAGATSAAAPAQPAGMVSLSSRSIVPAKFGSAAELTRWVETLRAGARPAGNWERSCAPACGKLTVSLGVVPGASLVGAANIGSARPAVAIIEPAAGQPANRHTNDPYQIETGRFTYVVYIEKTADDTSRLTWHILKIPYSESGGHCDYDPAAITSIAGRHYEPCRPAHAATGDDAAFASCGQARSRPAPQPAPTDRRQGAPSSTAAKGATHHGDPSAPLWVACLEGGCTVSGS